MAVGARIAFSGWAAVTLLHGGGLRKAANDYGIPLQDWQDFSTAINPQPWPVPALPPHVWQRLPEENDGLLEAAACYYGNSSLLPVPGTQAVIETLPRLVVQRRVWVPAVGYQEHAYCWQKNGHTLKRYTQLPSPDTLQTGDIVVVINPNNPTGILHTVATLAPLISALKNVEGLLIVDEAFMDTTPTHSLLNAPLATHVMVMRSFGKFFGLAGLRLGFCFADPAWLQSLATALGPWAVNHPARWIAQQALADQDWQAQTRDQLQQARAGMMQRLQHALKGCEVTVRFTDLFITLQLHGRQANALHQHLAKQGLLTRLFCNENLLRIGVDPHPGRQEKLAVHIAHWVGSE